MGRLVDFQIEHLVGAASLAASETITPLYFWKYAICLYRISSDVCVHYFGGKCDQGYAGSFDRGSVDDSGIR